MHELMYRPGGRVDGDGDRGGGDPRLLPLLSRRPRARTEIRECHRILLLDTARLPRCVQFRSDHFMQIFVHRLNLHRARYGTLFASKRSTVQHKKRKAK